LLSKAPTVDSPPSGRSVKAFCVGQAKSGTASVWGLLRKNYRAAHEPERARTLETILKEATGAFSTNAVRAYLLERDCRLNLEYDIAWANQFLLDHLLAVYREAKFIVLVRDCYTWLQSIAGHLMSREIPLEVRELLDWWFQPDRHPHTSHDRMLAERGLYSVAAYLSAFVHKLLCRWLLRSRPIVSQLRMLWTQRAPSLADRASESGRHQGARTQAISERSLRERDVEGGQRRRSGCTRTYERRHLAPGTVTSISARP